MSIQDNMIQFIDSFHLDCYIKVKLGSSISRPFLQEECVPQGSVLSVNGFAVAINSITEAVSSPVKNLLYADDLAIYCAGYDAFSVCRYLQKSVDKVSKWGDENGFKFSNAITMAVKFTQCKS